MKVLFCGGPADGQWRDVAVPTRDGYVRNGQPYEVVAPPTPLEFARGTGTLTKVMYYLWNIQVLGHPMLVAAPRGDHNESDSVLYAVLRRDVADHLRGRP
ncbi:hypothetical protein ACFY7C_19300 [Streptomyces sp. NPDC012769]|uniref:hypothetical protein n=1 Tax=Streptomyces sp. NPDC012769 TaxID=3364848 RepID=UPI0036A81EB0